MRRSVFLKIAIGFVCLYAIYTVGFLTYSLFKTYDDSTERSFRTASNYLNMGRLLLQTENLEDLSFRLDDAMNNHEIGYYLIRKDGEDVVYSNAAGADDPVVFADIKEDGSFEKDNYRHFVINEGPYFLAVGYKTSLFWHLKTFLEVNSSAILKDFLFVTLLVMGLVLYAFHDMILVILRLKKRGLTRSDATVAKSSETLTLLQGLKGYEENVGQLAKENALLKGQVLPALQNELQSGKTPPYEFGCTLVRTDINNFTTIFTGHDRAKFMDVINEFFVGVAHIASRYGGFVYELIGDEVIYYFKDENHKNSSAIAVSAVRDINALADQFNDRTEAEHGYSFRVKTSLSHGLLRFGPLVNGYSLAGNPLIETVRMLTHVHEKSLNTVLFDDSVQEAVSSLVHTKELGVVMLKGIKNSRRLHVYQAHVPLSNHLRQRTPEHFALATFYRSHADLCEILDFLRSTPDLTKPETLQLLGQFREFRVTEDSPEIRQSYVELIDQVLNKLRESTSEQEETSFILASLISSASHLFPSKSLGGRLREKLLECLKVENRRVVANTVDVFIELDPAAGEKIFAQLLEHNDNRIMANALIKQAKAGWNSKVQRRLTALMKVQSAYFKASGLYALGEIAKHLKATDEVAYRADLSLQALITSGMGQIAHANKMVRGQAIRLAVKLAAEEQLVKIAGSTKGVRPEVLDEIKSLTATQAQSEEQKPKLKVVS